MSRTRRMILLMVSDALLVILALWLALWLRFDGAVPAQYLESFRTAAMIFTVISLAIFYPFGLYNRLWQYAGLDDISSIAGAVTLSTLVNAAAAYALTGGGGDLLLPRSVFVFFWLLNLLFVGGSRLSLRLFRRHWSFMLPLRKGTPVLIVGAGDAGVLVAKEIRKLNQGSFYPIGFVDDNPTKQNLKLLGLPILGDREDIPRLVDEYGVREIVIAIPSAPRNIIREIVDICQTTPVSLKILPGLYTEEGQGVVVSQIRRVQVEDLLGREPVKVNLSSMSGYLSGRTVLVTGAGGSIGSELSRQIARFGPERLILLGHGENSIYEIYQELRADFNGLKLAPVIADVRDYPAMEAAFECFRPRVVFHAAAHKHVPLMEDNPAEAVKNNILGTWNVARAARNFQAETLIYISTDKAVNPTGIMGATKRVAEMIVQEYFQKGCRTRFAAVRFGNVLDSRGSVVPLFKKQIDRGGPVTVTHPEMTRFFMTISEAVQLVIQAGAMAAGGEIFVLDMGEPVKIVDLARRMIRLAGFEPEKNIRIIYSGIRPGEKLYEEILTAQEGISATLHQRIFVARPDGIDRPALERLLQTVGCFGWTAAPEEVTDLLQTVLPDFKRNRPPEIRARA